MKKATLIYFTALHAAIFGVIVQPMVVHFFAPEARAEQMIDSKEPVFKFKQ